MKMTATSLHLYLSQSRPCRRICMFVIAVINGPFLIFHHHPFHPIIGFLMDLDSGMGPNCPSCFVLGLIFRTRFGIMLYITL